MPPKDPYEALELNSSASDREIKSAFRTLARTHHPDAGGDPEEFKIIQESYAIIGDPVKRAAYDMERRKSGVSNAREVAASIADEYLSSIREKL